MLCLVDCDTVFSRVEYTSLTELSFLFRVSVQDAAYSVACVAVRSCRARCSLLTNTGCRVVELGLHEVLRAASTSFSRRDRLYLDVMNLGAMCSQRVIHLHRAHQHLVIARKGTLRYELAAQGTGPGPSCVHNLIVLAARLSLTPIDLSEELNEFVGLLCLCLFANGGIGRF